MTPHHNYASSKYKFLDKAQFDALYGNKKTDVLIVGGCFHFLLLKLRCSKQQNINADIKKYSVSITEICYEHSKRSGGKEQSDGIARLRASKT